MKLSGLFQGDRVIWIIFISLCTISVVEVFSAASTLTYQSGSYIEPFARHATFILVGIVLATVISRMPCQYFKIFVPIGIVLSVVLLLVLLAGHGKTINGAARWMVLFGIPLQPSEIAKGTLVITTAFILSMTQTENGTDPSAFKWIITITIIICGLILPENFSTAALIFGVVIIMMFIGRVSIVTIGKFLGVVIILAFAAVVPLISTSDSQAQWIGKNVPGMKRVPTWKNRIEKKLGTDTKEITPETFNIDEESQIGHSKIAIASSNVIGKGPGNSVERDFIPQAFSDFIYAIIVEELGLVGAFVLLALYILLLFRVGYIAKRFTSKSFPPFLAMGLALLLVVQAMANMMVATGILPVTGQPLPLVSRGGTSTLINCMYIGMILSVSRASKKEQRNASETKSHAAEQLAAQQASTAAEAEEIPPAEQTAAEIEAGDFGDNDED